MFIDIMLTVALGVMVLGWIVQVHSSSNLSKELDLLREQFYISKDKIRELDNKIWEVENRIRTLEVSTKPHLTFPTEGERKHDI